MPNKYINVSRLVVFFVVTVSLGIAPAQAAGGLVNFFPEKLVYGQGIESYLTVKQGVLSGNQVNFPIGLSDNNSPNDLNQYFFEVGPTINCVGSGDCLYHPYTLYRDGPFWTDYLYIDTHNWLTIDGSYLYQVHHVSAWDFAGYWCYGTPGGYTCLQEGLALNPGSKDQYKYVAFGYESSTGTKIIATAFFQGLKYQSWATQSWYALCPDLFFGTGNSGAAMYPCHYNGVDGYDVALYPYGSAFAPSMRRS